MSSKDRDSRCQLQERMDSVDSIGQPSTEWQTVREFYADIRYLSGLSAIKAGADTSTAKVSIRALPGAFNAGQRVVCGGVVFEIAAVLPGKGHSVDLVCVVTA